MTVIFRRLAQFYNVSLAMSVLLLCIVLAACAGENRPKDAQGQSTERVFGDLTFDLDRKKSTSESTNTSSENNAQGNRSRSLLSRITGDSAQDDSSSGRESVALSLRPNTYLWRGALDVVGVFPLSQVDPTTGIIITEWYAPPLKSNIVSQERFRLNVFITTPQFRSDGVRVVAFHERKQGENWQSLEVKDVVEQSIVDTILTRANSIRVSTVPSYDSVKQLP